MLDLGDETRDFLTSVKNRGVAGDRLLDVQDTAEEIIANGGKINSDGTVTLYHATTPEAKFAIESTGKFVGKEPNIFFSTSPSGQIKGYGDSIVEFKVPLEKLELDDVFGTEAHLKMANEGIGKSTEVGKYINKLSTVDDLTKPMEERLLDSRTLNEVIQADSAKWRNVGKGEQTILKLVQDNRPPKSMRTGEKLTYSELIKKAKKSASGKRTSIANWDENTMKLLKNKRTK